MMNCPIPGHPMRDNRFYWMNDRPLHWYNNCWCVVDGAELVPAYLWVQKQLNKLLWDELNAPYPANVFSTSQEGRTLLAFNYAKSFGQEDDGRSKFKHRGALDLMISWAIHDIKQHRVIHGGLSRIDVSEKFQTVFG